jgi:hypothetical protein
MSINVQYSSALVTAETLAVNAGHQMSGQAVTSQLTRGLSALGTSSTPPCSQRAGADLALSGGSGAGSGTIDLTALTGINGVAVNGIGLRVQFAKFSAPATNADAITVAIGGTNGCDNFGTSFSLQLAPGAEALFMLNSAGSLIGSTNKILTLTGSGSDVLSHEIVMG